MTRYYLYQADNLDDYFIMDSSDKRTPKVSKDIKVKLLLLQCNYKKNTTGFFINSIEESQLNMYLVLDPNLTISGLIDIIGDQHEMPLS